MWYLRTFGEIGLTTADGAPHTALLDHPKRLAVFLYLAREPGVGHQRENLLAMFWPESTSAKARNALRQSLHVIRATMGSDVIVGQGPGGVVVPPHQVVCDAARFTAALARGRSEEALELYRGEYLSGFYLDGAPEFERWVDREREHAQRLAAQAAEERALEHQDAGRLDAALRCIRRARELAPYNESAARQHIALLASQGNRAQAATEYRTFRRRLGVDLGVTPSPATDRLWQRLRNHPASTSP